MINSQIFMIILVIILALFLAIIVTALMMNKKQSDDELDFDSYERFHEIDLAIDRAIKNEDFDVVYQPIFSLDNEEIVAAEALLRLNDPELGMLLPDTFIPVAEKTGKILPLGKAVLKRVCEFIKNSNLQDTKLQFLEINLSIMESLQENLGEMIINMLDSYGISREFIALEIKESAISLMNKSIQKNINELDELGVRLTLDDYGTGDSTVAYVMTLPFKGVKIDRTMLWKAIKNPNAMLALCANINTLRDMDTKIMVEGAESEEMVEKLRSIKCDYVQGFYFATPMLEDELIEFMSKD